MNTVVYVPVLSLCPVTQYLAIGSDKISYVTAAARVADALAEDVLLAPIESTVIPLPHQIRALSQQFPQTV